MTTFPESAPCQASPFRLLDRYGDGLRVEPVEKQIEFSTSGVSIPGFHDDTEFDQSRRGDQMSGVVFQSLDAPIRPMKHFRTREG